MIILGIDPGLTGGLVWYENGTILHKKIMPTYTILKGTGKKKKEKSVLDMYALHYLLMTTPYDTAVLESVHSMTKQGVAGVFTFGQTFGAIEMALVAVGKPYEKVTPQKWVKLMHKDETDENPKIRSRNVVAKLFPNEDLKETPRCKFPHSGIVDALMMAVWKEAQNIAT